MRARICVATLTALAGVALAASWPGPGHAQTQGLATATGLLATAPFDRLALVDGTVLEVEPVSPRPLPAYDASKEKSRRLEKRLRPKTAGNIPLPGEKAKAEAEAKEEEAVPSEITIHLLKGEVRDYKLKRTDLKAIQYFEQMLLAEGDRYRMAHDYVHAFECYLRVETRHPDWPGLDDHVNRLLFEEGSAALLEGGGENGLRLLGELSARKPDYPGLADRLAAAYGSRIARAFDLGMYARGRKILHELEPLAPNHPAVRDAREKFLAKARSARDQAARSQGAERLDALSEALRVWPELEGAGARYAEAFAAMPTLDVGVPDTSRAPGPWVRCPADERISRLLYLPVLERGDEEAAEGRRPDQLAARLESAELGRRLTLQIRPGILWSGSARPVSAIDVFNTLLALTEPGSPRYSARWADLLERVEALDESRLEFRLARPLLRPEAWLITPVGPASLGPGGRLESDGRYRWTGSTDTSLDLRAAADPAAPGRPRIVRIRETSYRTAKALVAALISGEVSLAAHVPPERLLELAAASEIKIGTYEHPSLHRICLDGRTPVLKNRTLRRALSYAIDRKSLLEETLVRHPADEQNRVLDGPFAKGSSGDAVDVKPLDYDPLLARMLVAAARKELGGDPIKLTLEYPTLPEPQAVVPKLVEAFGLAGVEIVPIERPESELEAELRAGRKFELAYRISTCVEPVLEAGGFLCPGIDAPPSADALSSVASPRILQLLLQLERAPEWPTAKGLALEIDRECRDELPIVPLWQLQDHYAWRTRLEGPAPTAERLYQGIEKWTIAPWFARDSW